MGIMPLRYHFTYILRRTGVRLFGQVATKREEGGLREKCSGRDCVENARHTHSHSHTQPRPHDNRQQEQAECNAIKKKVMRRLGICHNRERRVGRLQTRCDVHSDLA